MTLHFPTLLIAAVFASQIVVCSFLAVWRINRAAGIWRAKYPPEEYPRFYPMAVEKMQAQRKVLMALRIAIGVGAVLVLAISLSRGTDPHVLSQYMIWIAGVQMLPLLLSLPQLMRISKAMRNMPAPAIRSAELRSWRITEFVSPIEIALGIVASIPPPAIALYFQFHQTPQGAERLAFVAVISGLLLVRMLYVLFTPVTLRRPDPYMSEADLFRARRLRWRLLFWGGAFMGAYITFLQVWAAGWLRIDQMYVDAIVSILVQLYSLFLTHWLLRRFAERDLTPYRAQPAGDGR